MPLSRRPVSSATTPWEPSCAVVIRCRVRRHSRRSTTIHTATAALTETTQAGGADWVVTIDTQTRSKDCTVSVSCRARVSRGCPCDRRSRPDRLRHTDHRSTASATARACSISRACRLLEREESRRLTGTHTPFTWEQIRSYLEGLAERSDRADPAIIGSEDDSYLGEVVQLSPWPRDWMPRW